MIKAVALRNLFRRLFDRARRFRLLLAAVVLSLALFPFFALSFYNQPFWDDFGNANLVRTLGLWGAQTELYTAWTGRYASSFLLTALNPLSYGWIEGLHFTPLLLLAGTWGALGFVLRTLSCRWLGWQSLFCWTALGLWWLLFWLPSPYAAFYWFAAGMVYQAPIILLLLGFGLALRALRARRPAGAGGWFALAAGCVVCTVAANELALLLTGWVLGILSGLAWWRGQRKQAYCWSGLLLIAVAAGVVSVLAPGNFVRLSSQALPGNGFRIVGQSIRLTFLFLAEPSQATMLLLSPVLFGPLGWQLRPYRPAGLRLGLVAGVTVIFGGLALCFLFLVLTGIGMPPARTANFLCSWLCISWLAVLWAWLPPDTVAIRALVAGVRWPVLLYVAAVGATGLESRAWRELLSNARPWQQQQSSRYQQLAAAVKAGHRTFDAAPIRIMIPQNLLIVGETVFPNASMHSNRVMAGWFGLDTLTCTRPQLPGITKYL